MKNKTQLIVIGVLFVIAAGLQVSLVANPAQPAPAPVQQEQATNPNAVNPPDLDPPSPYAQRKEIQADPIRRPEQGGGFWAWVRSLFH